MEPLTMAALAYGGGKVIGGISNYLSDEAAAKREAAAARARGEGYRQAGQIGEQYYQGLQQEYAPEASTYLSDLAGYRAALGQQPTQMGEFDTSLNVDVNAFLDPNVAYRQQQAQQAIDASAAARGGVFSGSGAQAKALQDRSQQIAQEAWDSAYNRAYTSASNDRAFKYQDFLNRFRAMREGEQQRLANLGQLSTLSGTARQNLLDARGGQANVKREAVLGAAGVQSDIQQLRANQLRQRGQNISDMAGGAGQLAGGMFAQQAPQSQYLGDAVELGLTGQGGM